MKKYKLIAFLPLILSSCDVPKVQCENKCSCNCQCSCTVVNLSKDNYKKYIRIAYESTSVIDNINYILLKTTGTINIAFYNNVVIKYNVLSDLEENLEVQTLTLDYSGNGKTKSFKFTFDGLIENFNGFQIIDVSGTCAY